LKDGASSQLSSPAIRIDRHRLNALEIAADLRGPAGPIFEGPAVADVETVMPAQHLWTASGWRCRPELSSLRWRAVAVLQSLPFHDLVAQPREAPSRPKPVGGLPDLAIERH
jgi:hypothetical protein